MVQITPKTKNKNRRSKPLQQDKPLRPLTSKAKIINLKQQQNNSHSFMDILPTTNRTSIRRSKTKKPANNTTDDQNKSSGSLLFTELDFASGFSGFDNQKNKTRRRKKRSNKVTSTNAEGKEETLLYDSDVSENETDLSGSESEAEKPTTTAVSEVNSTKELLKHAVGKAASTSAKKQDEVSSSTNVLATTSSSSKGPLRKPMASLTEKPKNKKLQVINDTLEVKRQTEQPVSLYSAKGNKTTMLRLPQVTVPFSHRPSNRAFKSLNFMFPEDKLEAKTSTAMVKGFIRRPKQDKVRFDEVTKCHVYHKEALAYEDRWNDVGVVYLRLEQSLNDFIGRYSDLKPQIYANEAKAREYWSMIKDMKEEPPFKRPLDDDDNEEREIFMTDDYSVASDVMSFSPSMMDDEDEADLDKEIVRYDMDSDAEKGDPIESEPNLELDSFKLEAQQLVEKFRKLRTKKVEKVSSQGNRESRDEEILREIQEMTKIPSALETLKSEMFVQTFKKYLTLKLLNQLLDSMKIYKSFRKLASHKVYSKDDKFYDHNHGIANNIIEEILDMIKSETAIIEQIEQNRRTKNQRSLNSLKGLPGSAVKDLRRRIITMKANQTFVVDFLNGQKYKALLANGRTVAEDFDNIAALQDLGKNKRKWPRPDICVPDYWRGCGDFFINPQRAWLTQKLKFAEQYINLINFGIIAAMLNDNGPLLETLVQHKVPDVVIRTSMEYRLKKQALNLRGVKTTERTWNHKSSLVYRASKRLLGLNSNNDDDSDFDSSSDELDDDDENVHSKERLKERLLRNMSDFKGVDLDTPIVVDALCGYVHPVVRADLHYSRRRQSCSDECTGHRGKLLLTMIRMGNIEMAEYLVNNGIKVNSKTCSGQAIDIYWEYDPKVQSKLKQQGIKGIISRKGKSGSDSDSENEKSKIDKQLADYELPDEPILGDEVSMKKEKQKEVGAAEQPEEDQESKSDSEGDENDGEMDPSVKMAFQKTISYSRLRERRVSDLKDNISFLDSKKIQLTSKYDSLTPLACAVECAISGGSLDMVKMLLSHDADVVACKNLAVRCCLPLLEKFAKAAKFRTKRLELQRLRNQDKPRPSLMLSLERMKAMARKKKSSIYGAIKSSTARPKLGNSQQETMPMVAKIKREFAKQDGETFKEHHDNSKHNGEHNVTAKTVASVKNPEVECLDLIVKCTQEALGEDKFAQSFRGHYPTIVVKITLLYEALMLEKWDVVRFVAPCVDNNTADFRLFDPARLRTMSYDSGMSVDGRFVHFEPIVAVSLSKVIDVLLNVGIRETTTTHSRTLNAIYFIFMEYNIYLEQTQMKKLVDVIMAAMEGTVDMRPADKLAVARLFATPQLKHYLLIDNYEFYERRTLEQYTFKPGKPFKVRKTKHYIKQMKMKRQLLLTMACGVGISEVVDLLSETKNTLSGKVLEEMLLTATFYKHQITMIPKIIEILDRFTDQSPALLLRMLRYCMADGDEGNEDSDIIRYLIGLHVRPGFTEAKTYLLRTLYSPPLGPQDKYKSHDDDICKDLSRIFNFKYIVDFLFKEIRPNVKLRLILKNLFMSIVAEVSKLQEQDLWLQGLKYLFEVAESQFPELNGKVNEQNDVEIEANELFLTVKERVDRWLKWDLEIHPNLHRIIMVWINKQPEFLHEMDLELLKQTHKLHVHDGQVVSELL